MTPLPMTEAQGSPAPIAEARVMHLLPHQGVGGLQRSVIEVVRHERMDARPDEIVLTERPLDVDRDFLAPSTPVHFLGLIGEPAAARGRRLADLATSRGARILHAYRYAELEVCAAAKRAAPGLRVIAALHDRPADLGFLAARRRRKALAAADHLVVPTPALVDPWKSAGREPGVQLLGVDVQRFHVSDVESSWRAARLPDPNTLLVGSMMRADGRKGHDVLMAAAEKRHSAGRPTALLMVGDGERFPELKERARGSDVLHARRRVLDAPGFFGRIDVFALHDESELVPMSLVESLACGRAAIVADRGDVAQFVGADAALFTEPGDVDAVVAAMDELADPVRRQQFRDIGRQRAVERHALGRQRGELAKLYA